MNIVNHYNGNDWQNQQGVNKPDARSTVWQNTSDLFN